MLYQLSYDPWRTGRPAVPELRISGTRERSTAAVRFDRLIASSASLALAGQTRPGRSRGPSGDGAIVGDGTCDEDRATQLDDVLRDRFVAAEEVFA